MYLVLAAIVTSLIIQLTHKISGLMSLPPHEWGMVVFFVVLPIALVSSFLALALSLFLRIPRKWVL